MIDYPDLVCLKCGTSRAWTVVECPPCQKQKWLRRDVVQTIKLLVLAAFITVLVLLARTALGQPDPLFSHANVPWFNDASYTLAVEGFYRARVL